MTDRELLEKAAKAAGNYLDWFYPLAGSPVAFLNGSEWNPLTEDGDALRLAVKLELVVSNDFETSFVVVRTWNHEIYVSEPHNNDPYAATRRAIVRAAAEIGKAMP